MSLTRIHDQLARHVADLQQKGVAKGKEKVITDVLPAQQGFGERYLLDGFGERAFLRMNSNSYLGLGLHQRVLEAETRTAEKFGAGPGAVRFISGTYAPHVELERELAAFHDREAGMIMSAAYATVIGVLPQLISGDTLVVSDALNHNCIIRAMRISNVPGSNRAIYDHNDMDSLRKRLDDIPQDMERVVVIFDGVFSMRGDCAPIDRIVKTAEPYQDRFKDGVITVVDDSHGIGAFGKTGRGTAEFSGAQPDVIIGTFGKAFGVNGGFVAASAMVIEAIRQKADTYIYTNPLGVADCAAAVKAIDICDSPEGLKRLDNLQQRILQFRAASLSAATS